MKTSITEGIIWKAILSFFFPILFGTFFQQLYNTVDAVVVGRVVGKEALAAVGGGVAVYVNLLVGFFVGLSSGATVIVSQFFGAKREKDTQNAVHTSFMLSLIGGFIIMLLGFSTTRLALILMNTPEEIMSFSEEYLRIYFAGMIPLFVYNMGSGILRAVGDSKTPLYILIASCFVNIALDLLFVVAFRLGIAGAAWATVISETFSMIVVCAHLARSEEWYRLRFKELSLTPHILKKMLALGFPRGLQSSMYTISNIIIQTSINSFGTTSIAAWAAYGKLDVFFWMIVSAFGISVTTFAGQNFGAGKMDRVKKSMKITMLMAMTTTIALTVFFCAFCRPLYTIFTTDDDVIREGVAMLRFLAPTYITFVSIEILSGVIEGCGVTFVPMLISIFGICVLRVLWIVIAVPIKREFVTVELSYPITWSVTSLLYWLYYLSGKWERNPQSKLTAQKS